MFSFGTLCYPQYVGVLAVSFLAITEKGKRLIEKCGNQTDGEQKNFWILIFLLKR